MKGEDVKVLYDFSEAREDLEKLGMKGEDVDHFVEVANEISIELSYAMDAIVAERIAGNVCVHPESLCLALAFLSEKYLALRLDGGGIKKIDTVALIQAVRKFVEIGTKEVDEDLDEVETPRPTTIH